MLLVFVHPCSFAALSTTSLPRKVNISRKFYLQKAASFGPQRCNKWLIEMHEGRPPNVLNKLVMKTCPQILPSP